MLNTLLKLAATAAPTKPQHVVADAKETFCNLMLAEVGAEVVQLHLCRVSDGELVEVGTVILPVSGWLQSVAWQIDGAATDRGH